MHPRSVSIVSILLALVALAAFVTREDSRGLGVDYFIPFETTQEEPVPNRLVVPGAQGLKYHTVDLLVISDGYR